MRYYQMVITNPATGQVVVPPSSALPNQGYSYTSFLNGQTLPGALNVELDIPTTPFARPMGAGYLRVWGVSLQEINQAANLNGFEIAVYAGFQKGYPLANPQQAGLIVKGTILQAFGNWIGTEQSLDLIIYPVLGSIAQPKNIVIDWKAGSQLAPVIKSTLQNAFPGYGVNVNISANLVRPNDQPGYYQTLEQFAAYIKQITKATIGGDYPGVDITLTGTDFSVFDGTVAQSATQIAFQDLIGQPTWRQAGVINFKCPMRSDLSVGQVVTMPAAVVTTTQNSASNLVNLKSSFQGNFSITQVRHVGNYRQPTADSWVTVFDAATIPVAA